MARAKRTDRTDARRRYRAEVAATGAEPVEETAAPVEDTSSRRRGAPSAAATPAPARPSMRRAFRGAMHPVDVRGDLRALPEIFRHWSIAVAIGVSLISVIATALFISSTNELGASLDFSLAKPYDGREISGMTSFTINLIPMFVTPPPLAGALFVGFFARRASWLLGLGYGVVAAVCYSVLVTTPAGRIFTLGGDATPLVVQAWVIGPVGAALFASAAAWYRRFLDLINPNRGRRPTQAKPVQGRGNVPRNRLSGPSRR